MIRWPTPGRQWPAWGRRVGMPGRPPTSLLGAVPPLAWPPITYSLPPDSAAGRGRSQLGRGWQFLHGNCDLVHGCPSRRCNGLAVQQQSSRTGPGFRQCFCSPGCDVGDFPHNYDIRDCHRPSNDLRILCWSHTAGHADRQPSRFWSAAFHRLGTRSRLHGRLGKQRQLQLCQQRKWG